MREQCYLLAYFSFDHLPKHLQVLSKPFYGLAVDLEKRWAEYPMNSGKQKELEFAMRKLLEAKDCAVRAGL